MIDVNGVLGTIASIVEEVKKNKDRIDKLADVFEDRRKELVEKVCRELGVDEMMIGVYTQYLPPKITVLAGALDYPDAPLATFLDGIHVSYHGMTLSLEAMNWLAIDVALRDASIYTVYLHVDEVTRVTTTGVHVRFWRYDPSKQTFIVIAEYRYDDRMSIWIPERGTVPRDIVERSTKLVTKAKSFVNSLSKKRVETIFDREIEAIKLVSGYAKMLP